MDAAFAQVEALVFDMFGTVVDCRESVATGVSTHLGDYLTSIETQ